MTGPMRRIEVQCECCLTKFPARPCEIERGKGKFCSPRCATNAQRKSYTPGCWGDPSMRPAQKETEAEKRVRLRAEIESMFGRVERRQIVVQNWSQHGAFSMY
jgi:hypothetical protein